MKKPTRLPCSRAIPALFVLLLAMVLTGCRGNMQGQSLGSVYEHRDNATTPAPDMTPFVGVWIRHSAGLTVTKDGNATFIERVYRWCGPDVTPPCDSWQGDTIISGNRETMRFTRTDSTTAYGTILSSTSGRQGRAVTLMRTSQDTVTLATDDPRDTRILCGPHTPTGLCGA